jgi:hypothetical protein
MAKLEKININENFIDQKTLGLRFKNFHKWNFKCKNGYKNFFMMNFDNKSFFKCNIRLNQINYFLS